MEVIMEGWQFRNGDTLVIVAEPNPEAAERIAAPYLPNGTDTEPKRIPSSVLQYFNLAQGGVVTAHVINRVAM